MLDFIKADLRLLLYILKIPLHPYLYYEPNSIVREWDEKEKYATIVKNYLIAIIHFCSSFDIKHLTLSRALRSAHLPIFSVMKDCKSMRYLFLRLWPLWLKVVTVKELNLYHSGTWLETILWLLILYLQNVEQKNLSCADWSQREERQWLKAWGG